MLKPIPIKEGLYHREGTLKMAQPRTMENISYPLGFFQTIFKQLGLKQFLLAGGKAILQISNKYAHPFIYHILLKRSSNNYIKV